MLIGFVFGAWWGSAQAMNKIDENRRNTVLDFKAANAIADRIIKELEKIRNEFARP